MFEEFFHLRENPFALAPNPRFIFQSHEHVEALAHFRYWIENGEGFVLITGEVGTGKTTALFDLMAQLPDEWSVGFVANSSLAAHELLEEVCRRFRIEIPPNATRPTLLARLENYLAEREDHGLRSLLILDEAQNFETRLLEEVRLLSNLERATGKLLQIALIGQPELDRKLELPELRQLRQRIGIRYRLGPLSEEECVRYIHHRVAVAGGDAEHVFPVETGLAVFRLTHGIPREINVVASQALITAFVQGAESVRPEHVQAVVEEFNWSSIFGREVPPPRARRPRMSEGPGLGGIAPRPASAHGPTTPAVPRTAVPRPQAGPPPATTPAHPTSPITHFPTSIPNPAANPVSPPPAGGMADGPSGQPKTPPARVEAIRPRPALEVVRGRGAERGEQPGEPVSGLGVESPIARIEIPIVRSEPEPPRRSEPMQRAEPMQRPEPVQRPEPMQRPEPGHRAESAATPLRARPPAESPRRPVLLAEPEPKRRPWLLIAGIALVLALFVGGSFWFKAQSAHRQSKPRRPAPTAPAASGESGGQAGSETAPAQGPTSSPEDGSSGPARTSSPDIPSAEPPAATKSAPAKSPPAKATPAKRGTVSDGSASGARSRATKAEPVTAASSGGAAVESSADAEPSGGAEYAIFATSFVGDAVRVAEMRREYELQFGLPVAIVRVDWGSNQWRNRIYIGSYGTRDQAERARRSLVAEGRLPGDSQVRSFLSATEGVPAP
jgi:type II secretory pathway predicted ATPase ExeA